MLVMIIMFQCMLAELKWKLRETLAIEKFLAK